MPQAVSLDLGNARQYNATVKEIQEASLICLKEFDRICRRNSIEYFLSGGTMLGAVRHQGFIPWDDDVDVILKRDSFEKFLSIAESEMQEDFCLCRPDQYKNGAFLDMIPRFCFKGFQMPNCEKRVDFFGEKTGYCPIDLFVLDNCPDSEVLWKMQLVELYALYGMGWGRRGPLRIVSAKGAQKAAVLVLKTAGRFFSPQWVFAQYGKVSRKYADRESLDLFISNAEGPRTIGKRRNASWFSDALYVPFEDCLLPIPVGFHEYLTLNYGDYMQLPPLHERKPTHLGEV